MVDHIANREKIIDAIRAELVGPFPQGEELDTSKKEVVFTNREESYGPWRQMGTGEEILIRDTPTKRYGIGILYPYGTSSEINISDAGADTVGLIGQSQQDEENDGKNEKAPGPDGGKSLEKVQEKIGRLKGDPEDDLDLSLANSYRPSSMGISFLAEIEEDTLLIVKGTGGRYNSLPVKIGSSLLFNPWWVRSPVSVYAEFKGSSLLTSAKAIIKPDNVELTGSEGLDLRIELFSRPFSSGQRLITVCLVNRTLAESTNEYSLFQSHFVVSTISPTSGKNILPYPGPSLQYLKNNDEELGLALLYRNRPTFAVGHGCSADWDSARIEGKVTWVSAECLPQYETPSMTPDIKDKENQVIKVPMALLAGLDKEDNGFSTLERVISLYEEWIGEKESEISSLKIEFQAIAFKHIQALKRCASRMRDGLNYLKSDQTALLAFQLANYSILLQQIQSRKNSRSAFFDTKEKRIKFSEEYKDLDPLSQNIGRGNWRAFQIAFILMALKSSVDENATDRETVELIWFPTGGGKTEAYLGLAAFSMFMRRLNNQDDEGMHVLMRYTLRLLTAQQFQRSARLICAMEVVRNRYKMSLGNNPFSIGLWVGGDNTPNTRSKAITVLNGLKRGDYSVDNQFILDRCPWCGAQMGPLDYQGKPPKDVPRVIGYYQQGNTVVFKCPDNKCPFSTGLPVYVIDEDIYEFRPSLVIGTVDKFAMLAWRSEPRALFGLAPNGKRFSSPPGLIIQDELHLISGPLGSMVGLFEAVIEELCTDRRGEKAIKPKIISSTATIRRYQEQIRALYAREDAVLFPPPGLEEGDSFFGRYARKDDGSLEPGRKYIGIHAPGLGSMQTVQVRSFTGLLQAPLFLEENERDPWWTLLLFFNSLRELGTTLSLLQSDIPDYQQVFVNRLPKNRKTWRSFWEIRELTGRASGEDIPKSISALEINYPNKDTRPIDVCLASNILEVGVDIDRLSLMVIVGQPKTTSQYIQVSGRVGRSWWERPGLVFTIYGASKPRDRSHFEKFRSYHEKLYSQVEPTSVTPFSPPALDRSLHAIMAAYVQQLGNEENTQSPYPFPETMIDELRDILLPRVRTIDPDEENNFLTVFEKRSSEWKSREHTLWKANKNTDDLGLLRVAGAYATKEEAELSWPTQQSMRSVDAECITEIMLPVINQEGENTDAQ
jgi:hypothetical protein